MITVKIYKDGDSLVVPLPPEAIARLRVGEGDTLMLVESEGGYRVRRYDPDEKMTKAEEIMGRYRNTLKGLS